MNDAAKAERKECGPVAVGTEQDAKRYCWLRQYALGIYWDVFNDEDALSLGLYGNAKRLDAAIAQGDKT
jgi:hypothetical protein